LILRAIVEHVPEEAKELIPLKISDDDEEITRKIQVIAKRQSCGDKLRGSDKAPR